MERLLLWLVFDEDIKSEMNFISSQEEYCTPNFLVLTNLNKALPL